MATVEKKFLTPEYVTGEKIKTRVIKIHLFNNFKELYNDFNSVSLGYKNSEAKNPKDMEKYYSIEKQCQYGVVGIEIKLI